MTMTLAASDRLEIQELMARYAWSLDTGDEQSFVECFSSSGELAWEVFEQPGTWRGSEALRRFIGYFRQRPESAGRQHHVTNLLITPTAAGASSRSYVAVALRMGDGPHRLHVMGYYEDELVREGGRWCLARRCIRDWSGPVLARIAGQDGVRTVRPLPAPLAELWETRSR